MIAGEAIGHEPAVGVADDVDPLRIDRIRGLDLGDHRREVFGVVDVGVVIVTTGIRRVPVIAPALVDHAVRVGIEERPRVGEGLELEVELLDGAVDHVAVEHQDERRRLPRGEVRRHVDVDGAIPADHRTASAAPAAAARRAAGRRGAASRRRRARRRAADRGEREGRGERDGKDGAHLRTLRRRGPAPRSRARGRPAARRAGPRSRRARPPPRRADAPRCGRRVRFASRTSFGRPKTSR